MVDKVKQVTLTHKKVRSLRIVNWFLSRLGLSEVLEHYLTRDDARPRLVPAQVIELVVRNFINSYEALCPLNEWAAPYESLQLGWKLVTLVR
jgi:hypothetical protein